jgi:CheY-like chemotaxis protein
VTALDKSVPPVEADPSQIELILINLVLNARDAMPDGGKLTISSGTGTPDEQVHAAMKPDPKKRYVVLRVSDTGMGMDEDTIEHIYEPFFSTKHRGQGTGLGLATVHSSVKQHSGCIAVESAPGAGTTFSIYLPVSDGQVEREGDKRSPAELRGNGERILLVEDAERVRAFTARVLTENGYAVTEAADAEAASALLAKDAGEFALLLTDIVLPGESGLSLAEKFKRAAPDLEVILCSGYTEQRSQIEAARERNFRFIQKPFSRIELLRLIKDTLRPA